MTYIGSYRPPLWLLALFSSAYIVGCGFAQVLAIVPDITVSIWPPGGLFIATLILTSRQSWPWWIAAGCVGEMSGQFLWFHSPMVAGLLIYAGNALGAVSGAWLVQRVCGRSVRLETLREVRAFVILGAGVAPIISATVGSATLAWFGIEGQSFTSVWPLFWIGDATGALLVAPLTLVVVQNWGARLRLSGRQWVEAVALGLIFFGVAALALSDYNLPPYITLPPLLWAAVRFEFKGVAVALTLLAITTMALTIFGASQFIGDADTQREKQVMLQLFLAISAFSALIVAAISRQHRQAVLTLQTNEKRLQQMIDAVPAMMWSATPDGTPTYVNKRYTDVTGATLEDFTAGGASPSFPRNVIHPEDAAERAKLREHAFRTGTPYFAHYRHIRSDGSYRWTETRAEPLRDEAGEILQWYGVSVDIHDLVTAQKALEEREAKIRRLVDSDIIGIVIWDLDGTVIEANDAFLRMVQYERRDVEAGLRWFDMTPPEWQETHAREEAQELAATGKMQPREKEYFRKDGSRVPVLIGAACFEGQSRQGVAYILDLTELKRTESALRASKQQLEQMIDAVPVNILSFSPDLKLTYASKRYLERVGSPLTHIDNFDALAKYLSHPDDHPEMIRRASAGFAGGLPFANRFRRRDRSGAYPWIEARAHPLRADDGAIVQWYVASIDIEDEMRAQEALSARERELSLLVDMVPSHLWRLTPDGETTFVNKRMADFVGMDQADKHRMETLFKTIFHPDDAESVWSTLARSLRTGKTFSMKYRLRRVDGEFRWMSGRAEPLRTPDGKIIQWFGLCHDIHDQVVAEEALRRAQARLADASQAASLAELSASIAHEVNQPLAAIVANSEACLRWLSAETPNIDRAKVTAERITRDAISAADVVSRIRALFRQTAHARSPEDINRLIGEVCRLMAVEIEAKNSRIDVDLAQGLPPVPLDRIQVQQVFVNLIRNAVEAMESVDGVRQLRIQSRREGEDILIEVCDAGTGFADAGRVLEPFFTTKPNGMGMGLAICRSIIEAHGGRLWTSNNETRGATVAFTLPLHLAGAKEELVL